MTVKINTKLTTENITKTPETEFSNSAAIPVVDNNEIKNILLSNLNGAGMIPNVITIDTSLLPDGSQDIEGKSYSTFAKAKDYCDTVYNDNPDARFEIHLPSGDFTEKIALAEHYIIIGHNTIITGPILYLINLGDNIDGIIKDCTIMQHETDATQRNILVYAHFINCIFHNENESTVYYKERFIFDDCFIYDVSCKYLTCRNTTFKKGIKTFTAEHMNLHSCNGYIGVKSVENISCYNTQLDIHFQVSNTTGSIVSDHGSQLTIWVYNNFTLSDTIVVREQSTLEIINMITGVKNLSFTANPNGQHTISIHNHSFFDVRSLTTSFLNGAKWSCDETSKCPEEILGYANMATPDIRNRVKIAYSKNGGTSINHNQGEQSNNDTHVGFMDALGGSSTNPSNYEWVHLTPSPHKTYIFDNFNNFNGEEDQNIFDYTIDNKTWRGFSIKMWNDTVSIDKNWSNYYSSIQNGTMVNDLENTGYRTQMLHPETTNKRRLSLNKWGTGDDISATVLGIDLQDITDDDWYIMNENGKKSYENKYVNYISKFIFPVYVVPNSSLIFVNKGATDYYMDHSGDIKFPYQIAFNITASLGIFSVERTSLNLCYLNYIPQASNPDNIYCFIEGTITKNIYGNIFKCEINILNSQPSSSLPITQFNL